MLLSIIIMIIGYIGIIINKNNIILLYICIEMLLLSVTLLMIWSGMLYNDIDGILYSITIIMIAGVESAIGLTILINYYTIKGTISIDT